MTSRVIIINVTIYRHLTQLYRVIITEIIVIVLSLIHQNALIVTTLMRIRITVAIEKRVALKKLATGLLVK